MFYFAWVDPTDTAFNPAFEREDEDVFSFDLSQEEGDFAVLSVTIRNPRIGLLNASRKLWAWFAVDGSSETVPLFFGRLVGIPDNVFAELVTLQFIARPANYYAAKEAHAQILRVLPWYDPIFIDQAKRTDPDTVLEARSERWHTDRVTHAVTTSDVLDGEDGLITFSAGEILAGSMSLNLSSVPVCRVQVTAEFNWKQRAFGTQSLFSNKRIETFGDLFAAWPQEGTGIGGEWSVHQTSIKKLTKYERFRYAFNYTAPPNNDDIAPGSSRTTTTSANISHTGIKPVPPGSIVFDAEVSARNDFKADKKGRVTSTSFSMNWQKDIIVKSAYIVSLTAAYNVERNFNETLSFEVTSDLQAVVTLPEDDEVKSIEMRSSSLSEVYPPDPNTADDVTNPDFPIGDTRRRSYINTERGHASIGYLLLMSRAIIRSNARAVTIEFNTSSVTKWADVTLRKNAQVFDDRLPGGQAVGKITAYRFSLDGNSGLFSRSITIGCAVGNGGAYVPVTGTPSYAHDDYVESDFQEYAGAQSLVDDDLDDILYTLPTFAPQDDGIDFLADQIQITDAAVENDAAAQTPDLQAIQDKFLNKLAPSFVQSEILTGKFQEFGALPNAKVAEAFNKEVKAYFEENATRIVIVLPNLSADVNSAYTIEVAPIRIPTMIDLGAASG